MAPLTPLGSGGDKGRYHSLLSGNRMFTPWLLKWLSAVPSPPARRGLAE